MGIDFSRYHKDNTGKYNPQKAKPPLKGNSAFGVKTVCISPTFSQDGLCSVLNFSIKFICILNILRSDLISLAELFSACQLKLEALPHKR